MATQHYVLLLLTALCGAMYFWQLHDKSEWFPTLLGNLTAGFLGAFLTVLFVDRVVRARDENERKRVRKLALLQLRGPLLNQLELLSQWYKAAALARPAETPSTVRALLSETFLEAIRFLDFSASAPTLHPANWFKYSAHWAWEFQKALDQVTSKYAIFLNSDMLELLESLRGSTLLAILQSSKDTVETDQYAHVSRTGYNMFYHQTMLAEVRDHVNLISSMAELLPIHAGLPLHFNLEDQWRDDVMTMWGSARTKNPNEPKPTFRVGSGIPS